MLVQFLNNGGIEGRKPYIKHAAPVNVPKIPPKNPTTPSEPTPSVSHIISPPTHTHSHNHTYKELFKESSSLPYFVWLYECEETGRVFLLVRMSTGMIVEYKLEQSDNHKITFIIQNTFDDREWKILSEFTSIPKTFLSYKHFGDRAYTFTLHLKNAITNDGHEIRQEHDMYLLKLKMIHHRETQDLYGETITSDDS